MTEAEWNTSTDVGRMLSFVAGSASAAESAGDQSLSERKARLFLVGCYHRWRPVFTPERLVTVTDVLEQYADGGVSESDFELLQQLAHQVYYFLEYLCKAPVRSPDFSETAAAYELAQAAMIICLTEDRLCAPRFPNCGVVQATYCLARLAGAAAGWVTQTRDGSDSDRAAAFDAECLAHAHLLRCVAGNPFRPVRADPGWRTAPVVGIAEAAYAGRAFDRLPILADALEDAGCADADVLTHCRAHPEHARGCWVVDLLLDKE
jgi:hypothetical protein